MKLLKCPQNHFYDGEQYDSCPHCAGSVSKSTGFVTAKPSVDPRSQMPLSARSMSLTQPLNEPVSQMPAMPATGQVPVSQMPAMPATGQVPVSQTPAMPATGQIPVSQTPVMPVAGQLPLSRTPAMPATGQIPVSQTPVDEQPPEVEDAEVPNQPSAPMSPEAVSSQPSAPAAPAEVPNQPSAPVSPAEVPNQPSAPVSPAAVPNQPSAPVSPAVQVPRQPSALASAVSASAPYAAPVASNEISKTVGFYDFGGDEPVVGWLVCVKGLHHGQSFQLQSGHNMVGRDIKMDVALTKDNSVSRGRHATILYDPKNSKFYIQQGESGFTYLNGDLVLAPTPMEPRALIGIGAGEYLFVPLCGDSFSWDDYN